jgi:hypothetical protein
MDTRSGKLTFFGLRTKVSHKDADDLRWFFEFGATSVHGRSTLAACIERLELFDTKAVPCERCGGEDSADPENARGGTGFLENPGAPRFAGLPPAADLVCPSCAGRGWLLRAHKTHAHAPLTARPSRTERRAATTDPSMPDYAILRKAQRISERLASVSERSLFAVGVLAVYYGPGGGSLGALWIFTPAGETMLENNPLGLSPAELFANERAAEKYSPTDTRSLLVRQANEAAEEILGLAHAYWNAGGDDTPKPLRPAA